MRAFEKTHPWITFKIILEPRSPEIWIMLGECQSKMEHIQNTPLSPRVAEELHKTYLAKGSHATTAIEGNTLTEEDVRKRLDKELELPPSKEYLGIEVDNMISVFNEIVEEFKIGARPVVCAEKIKQINQSILKGLHLSEEVVPGMIRKHNVGVGRYPAPHFEDCEYLIEKLCDWIKGSDFKPLPGTQKVYGILRAVIAHLYLAWIHPFGDGNGRTARMVEFQILVDSGCPVAAAHLLSSHYNTTRTEYYRQLDAASRSNGNIIPFIKYSVQGFLDGLKSQLQMLQSQALDLAWRDHVYKTFDQESKTQRNTRIRNLLLSISEAEKGVDANKLFPILSERVRSEYAKVTTRTLMRDIDLLNKMGLIKLTKNHIEARREIILPLMPFVAPPVDESDSDVKPLL